MLLRVVVVRPDVGRQAREVRAGGPPVVAAVVPRRGDGRPLDVDPCAEPEAFLVSASAPPANVRAERANRMDSPADGQ